MKIMKRLLTYAILIILFNIIYTENSMAQKNERELYDKFLASLSDDAIVKLKNEIETITGSVIQVKIGQMNIGANETLMSGFANQIPYIIIKNGHNPSSVEIYHELYHLWVQVKNGFYDIEINGDLLIFLRKRLKNGAFVINKAHSIFHHSYFFNLMINNKFHPTSYLLNQLEACIKDYPANSYPENVTFNIALDVWHLMLGIEDNSLDTKRYLNILKSNFKQEYELGQNLFEISKEFSSPEQEPYIFSKILRTLLNFDNQIYYKTKNHTIVFY